jgi:hypothetical protein
MCKESREISTALGVDDGIIVPAKLFALSEQRNGSCNSSFADNLSEAGTKHFSMKCFTSGFRILDRAAGFTP